MPQTSYSNSYTAAFEGMLADGAEPDIISKVNGEAATDLIFGRGVRETAAGAVNISAAGQTLLGVAVFEQKDTAALSGSGAIKPKETFNVLRKGRIWVKAEQAIVVGDPVYVRHTVNGGTTAVGRFRKDIDTANAILISNARWASTTSGADQMAVLEINLP
jgi:hypothetical protein